MEQDTKDKIIKYSGIGLVIYAGYKLFGEKLIGSSNMDLCPEATKNPSLERKNKMYAKNNLMYGPFSDSPPDFWQRLATKWNVPLQTAKKRVCGNCVAYDQSPRMKKCMNTDSSTVGYCWMHHFNCKATRTCQTWVAGGPITSDKVSLEKSTK
jgi:hypothetical protein